MADPTPPPSDPPGPAVGKGGEGGSGRPFVALAAMLLTVALGLSSAHLAIIAVQNLVELGPVLTSSLPPGVDLSAPGQRFVLSLISLLAMAVFTALLVKTALALLQQMREAMLGAIILVGTSLLFSVLVFNISIASLAARGILSGLLVVLLLLPASQAHFNREGPVYRKPKGGPAAAPRSAAPSPPVQTPPPVAAAAPPPPPKATQILCPACRSTVPSEFIFCTRCGADLRIKAPPEAPPAQAARPAAPQKRYCIQCGKPNSMAIVYCTECGAKME